MGWLGKTLTSIDPASTYMRKKAAKIEARKQRDLEERRRQLLDAAKMKLQGLNNGPKPLMSMAPGTLSTGQLVGDIMDAPKPQPNAIPSAMSLFSQPSGNTPINPAMLQQMKQNPAAARNINQSYANRWQGEQNDYLRFQKRKQYYDELPNRAAEYVATILSGGLL